MTVTTTNALREQLQAFAFTKVFQSRGWNAPVRRPFMLTVREREVTCTPIAGQGGWTVLEITAAGDGPDIMDDGSETSITAPGERAWREMVDKAVTDQIHHHVLIFVNPARTEALWQFSATISGKRLRRERRLNAGTPIAPLVALLRGMEIPFEILDDDGEVSVTAMNDRMAQIGIYADTVSKKFYDLLAIKREGFEQFLAWVDVEKDRDWYITALLNRLMFVYFIQHKGLMKGDTAYLRHRLNECITYGHNFYRDFLLPLCFFGFAKPWGERKKYGGHFDGIPYLNGGLFMPHEVELDHGITPDAVESGKLPSDITVPNEQFIAWFDFFDSYRWTLDEENTEYEGHINPDILGYIFEKYINQKEMGAYYTKEDITGYICRNTIIPRLFDMLAATGKKGALAVNPLPIGPHPNILNDGNGISGGEGIERYIYPAVKTQEHLPTETDREFLARQQRYEAIRLDFEDGNITAINDIITYNLDIERLALDFIAGIQDAEVLRDFYFDGLRKITVLDPTCGSGAFLFAALKVLYPLYAACVKKMEAFHAREAGGAAIAVTWKGEFAFANEVSQQLGFIDTPDDGRQAILDLFGAELVSIREHDNVEYFIYKRIIVDNLFGVDIMAEAVEICKLRLFLKLIAHAESVPGKLNMGIEPLPDVDFNILCGNTLVGFATHEEAREAILGKGQTSLQFDDTMDRIEGKGCAVDILATAFRQAQTARNVHATPDQKSALEDALHALEHELNGYLARRYGISSQESRSYTAWLESHQPFHWYVKFYGTMKRGGFDAVVGNPPYIAVQKKNYITPTEHTRKFTDIYAYVLMRTLQLCNATGLSGMIVPLSLTFSQDFGNLRDALCVTGGAWFSSYDNIPAALFSGVSQRCTIWIGKYGDKSAGIWVTPMHRWRAQYREFLLCNIGYTPIDTTEAGGFGLPKLAGDGNTRVLKTIAHRTGSNTLRFIPDERRGNFALGFSQAARNFISVFSEEPPCLTERTYSSCPTSKIGYVKLRDESLLNASLAMTTGELFFWYWLVRGDGFDVTGWIVSNYLTAVNHISEEWFSLLSALGTAIHNRRYEALVFKKNAGKFVGNFNYRGLFNITRRADLVLLAALGVDREDACGIFDYVQRVLSINESAGEKSVPAAVKAQFPPLPIDTSAERALFKRVDAHIIQYYGFTDEELDFIINHDIKYRMGRDTEGEDE